MSAKHQHPVPNNPRSGRHARWPEQIHRRLESVAQRSFAHEFLNLNAWSIWFYTACVAVFLAGCLMDLNGSSISLYRSLYSRGAVEKPLIGQAHWIRMDEWDFHTPAILNQGARLHPFRMKNTEIGSHSVSLLGNIPVAHISTIFRPQFWSFFLFPIDYAYAVYWQFKALILITGVFTWLLLITRSNLWAAAGSLWYFFSPCTQWTYSWPSLLPEMAGSFCFALVFACYLITRSERRGLLLAAVGFAACAINFGMCAYIPHMIPFGYLGVFFIVPWIISERSAIFRREGAIERLVAIGAAVILVVTIAGVVYLQSKAAILGVSDTVYPGKRVFPGETLNLPLLTSHFFSWLTSETHYPPQFGNICEASGFIWLAPVTLFCFGRLNLSNKQRATLIGLWGFLLFLSVWLLLPVHGVFFKLLVLDRTGGTRPMPALGLANISIVTLTMTSFGKTQEAIRRCWALTLGRAAGTHLVVAAILVLTDQSLGWYFSFWQLCLIILVTSALHIMVLEGCKRTLAVLLVVPSALLFGSVNPIERGLGVITSSDMYRLVQGHRELLTGKWLVFSDELWGPGFLTATGCDVYNGLHYLPDIDHFQLFAARGLSVAALNQSGYLLAHPMALTEKSSAIVVQAGWTRWNVSPLDPLLKQLGIRYVAFSTKPPSNITAQLRLLSDKPVDNYWLYRIP